MPGEGAHSVHVCLSGVDFDPHGPGVDGIAVARRVDGFEADGGRGLRQGCVALQAEVSPASKPSLNSTEIVPSKKNRP